jgi:ARG and Rhodanese-Phosphatase-superfamily-associated Protein domain
VFPLLTDADSSLDYLLSDEALSNDSIAVTEVSESGAVPELLVENRRRRRTSSQVR